jgi:hypothetical protein
VLLVLLVLLALQWPLLWQPLLAVLLVGVHAQLLLVLLLQLLQVLRVQLALVAMARLVPLRSTLLRGALRGDRVARVQVHVGAAGGLQLGAAAGLQVGAAGGLQLRPRVRRQEAQLRAAVVSAAATGAGAAGASEAQC